MKRYFYEHFNVPDNSWFLKDISDTLQTLIDKKDPKNPTQRTDYWMHILKNKAPLGLNVEDGL